MRVLVLWADDRSANLGVRALASGAAALARTAFGEQISIDFQDLARSADGFSVSLDLIKTDIRSMRGPIREWLRGYDIVLDTGAGDSFTDSYGWRRIFRMIYTQVQTRRMGVPLILTPQTIGPFTTRRFRAAARYSLKRASFVAARDSTSAAYAAAIGRPVDAVGTDVVFSLPQPVPAGARDVVLNVSGLLWTSDRHGSSERYRAEVRALIAGLQKRGRTVSLLAHVIDNPTRDNDVPVVEELGGEYSLEVIVPQDLEEVRSVVAAAQLVIGSRMHACLNAISTGTPAIAWAYSRKFAPLLADISWDHTVDLREDPSPSTTTLALIDSVSAAEFGRQVDATLAITVQRMQPVLEALRQLKR